MLIKLDGVQKHSRTGKKSEEEFPVVQIRPMKDRHRIVIDVDVTPLYCSICEKQLPHLYKHAGSRYGYVGEVECDFCGGRIGCVDSDNIVEYLHCGGTYIDYYPLYKLSENYWDLIKDKTGYDIYAYDNKYVPLENIINEICERVGLDIVNPESHGIITDEKFERLPKLIDKWLFLLKYLDLV